MTLENRTNDLLQEIRAVRSAQEPQNRLPQNAFYLADDTIVCCERTLGESRYPYDADGLVVWARSSGAIEACESTFHIFKPLYYAEDASVSFVAGFPAENGKCFPLSVLGGGRQLCEPIKVERYVVYAPRCAYYIADTEKLTLAVRLHVDENKHIHFAFTATNKTDKPVAFYVASVIDALLRFSVTESFWGRLSKSGYEKDGAFLLRADNACLVINRTGSGKCAKSHTRTVAKRDVLGAGRILSNATALEQGAFLNEHHTVHTTDIPVAAELLWFDLEADESVRLEYDLSYYHSVAEAEKNLGLAVSIEQIDRDLLRQEAKEQASLDTMQITFDDWNGGLCGNVLNRFLRNVQKQVSFCALGKNYAGSLIGMRDVMQQLEQSLIWDPAKSREKIITAMNFILEDGRPSRQFSLPIGDNLPSMDLREFIDQGVWIISTLYTYLAYTDDYSILDELCDYYVPNAENTAVIGKSDRRDTVLDHVVRVMDFLISHIDEKTGCLHILFGDWNDAVDKLGTTADPACKFGSGVSVMASLQLYKNCEEICEILQKTGSYLEKVERYIAARRTLESGLQQYAVETADDGKRRVIHGWGDDRLYLVGSFCDVDGVSRISSTANAFWALSDMVRNDPSMKSVLSEAFHGLKTKYGLRTFDKPFTSSTFGTIGRVGNLLPGTYENASTYVHASMFACMALFAIGESAFAWEQLERAMPITHPNCTMTPFVMPNSYCYNPEYGIDGESMGDWYTGSGTVLLKAVVKYGFGIAPDLGGLRIQMAKNIPCDHAEILIMVKGYPIKVVYNRVSNADRTFFLDEQEIVGVYDAVMDAQTVYIPTDMLHDGLVIRVVN